MPAVREGSLLQQDRRALFVRAEIHSLIGGQLAVEPGKKPATAPGRDDPGHLAQELRLDQGPDTAIQKLLAQLIGLALPEKTHMSAHRLSVQQLSPQAELEHSVDQHRADGQQARGQHHAQSEGRQDRPVVTGAANQVSEGAQCEIPG